jgi:hypothetical protein
VAASSGPLPAACATLSNSRGWGAGPGRARVRAPGAAWGDLRLAHPPRAGVSPRSPPHGRVPASRALRAAPPEARGAWGRGAGPALLDAEEEVALTASGFGGGRGSRPDGAAWREGAGRRGAPRRGMLGPSRAPSPFPAASLRAAAGPERATALRRAAPSRGANSSGSPGAGQADGRVGVSTGSSLSPSAGRAAASPAPPSRPRPPTRPRLPLGPAPRGPGRLLRMRGGRCLFPQPGAWD